MSYLDEAGDAIRDMEKELENSGYRHKYPAQWRTRQSEIAEHWLKLAAIEKGISPWAVNADSGKDRIDGPDSERAA